MTADGRPPTAEDYVTPFSAVNGQWSAVIGCRARLPVSIALHQLARLPAINGARCDRASTGPAANRARQIKNANLTARVDYLTEK